MKVNAEKVAELLLKQLSDEKLLSTQLQVLLNEAYEKIAKLEKGSEVDEIKTVE